MTPDLTLSTLSCPHDDDLQEAPAHLGCGYREMKMNTPEGIIVEGSP